MERLRVPRRLADRVVVPATGRPLDRGSRAARRSGIRARGGAPLLAATSFSALLLAGALGLERASANGVGDLYAATRAGVAEVLVAGGEVLATVPLRDIPRAIAFDPEGRVLYAATGGRNLEPIDIETLELTAAIPLPGVAGSLVHPNGPTLVVALAGDRRLALVDPGAGTTTRSAELPGSTDLLAADRRHPFVLAAESGKPWLALLAGDAPPVSTSLDARVTAVAVSRTGDLVVATRAPATIRRLAPTDLAVAWSVDLPAAPDAVAALADGVVAAGGRTLWWIDRSGARPWRTVGQPVTALVGSDDGTVVYAATADGVEAMTVDGRRSVHVGLDLAPGSTVLAPVPRPASLAGSDGRRPVTESGRPPATSTVGPGRPTSADLGLGLGVTLVVLVLGVAVARHVARESGP